MVRHFLSVLLLPLLIVSCDSSSESTTSTPPAGRSADPQKAVFRLVNPAQSGISFENALPENDQFNILSYEYYYNGGGVAIGDVNGDDLPDVVFTANLVANRLYLNRGNLTFEEAAQASGFVSRGGWKTGITMADVNADGHLDIYVCRSGNLGEAERRNELFLNQGDGTFREAAAEFGLDDPGYSTHATFFDYDRDGDLDCFVLNHALKPNFNLSVAQVKGQRHPFFGDHLYRNDGGKFVDVSEKAGIIGNPIGFGLSVTVEDFDRDGWLDLFVANDYTEQDYLYRNNGNGTFSEQLDPTMAHTSHFSMGSDAGDIDGDGWPDLMVLDMLPEDNYGQKILMGPDNYNKYQMQVDQGFYHQQMRNTLQMNLGKGFGHGQSFSETGQLMGISNTDWSWSPLMADFDNDGDLDIHVTNGYVRASTNLDFVKYDYPAAIRAAQQAGQPLSDGEVSKRIPTIHKSNAIFRNDGPDAGFSRVTRQWGLDRPSYSQGAAFGDLDGDGDLDLVVNNLKATAFLYENTVIEKSLELQLTGPDQNPFAIGAVVTAYVNGAPKRRILMTSRGFQSSVEPLIHIGLGEATQVDRLEIIWPNGDFQEMNQPLAAGKHRIAWEDGLPAYEPTTRFEAITLEQGFAHQDNQLVEFNTQPLLPHMLGRMGPCLDVHRIDDRNGEIFIGGGPGQSAVVMRYRIQEGANWCQWTSQELPATKEGEFTDLIRFDADGDGDQDLYLVAAGNEQPLSGNPYQDVLLIREGNRFVQGQLPTIDFSGGCVAAGDADGDGDLDLFVGGRVTVGAYPLNPPSKVLTNDGKGAFSDQTTQFLGTDTPGMITDAEWADLDGDGLAELILVGEWSGVRIFGRDGGKPAELSDQWGLQNSQGWWTRLSVADLDGDGDLDLVTGNMGENSQLHASEREPLRMYAADFDNNGTIDPILTYYMEGKEVPVAARDELLGQVRMLQRRFKRYEEYANAKITDIFTPEEFAKAQKWEAKILSSGWWEQENGRFTFHKWPLQAQVAPVFGQQVADLNGDGLLDVLLAGNFHHMRAETGRFDASTGSVLYGDGQGGFRWALPGREQGIWLEGDIRDLAVVPITGNDYLIVAVRNDSPWLWGRWRNGQR